MQENKNAYVILVA